MKKTDIYIIKKFLGTFIYAISLIILIVIIFDISEKIDDFLETDASFKMIVFDYYLNFIPFFINLFSPLFTFIAVIFFTAKMAANNEIITILSTGMSFRRMLLPYFIAATVLASLSLYLNNFVIPRTNQKRLAFEDTYLRNEYRNIDRNIHRQIGPGTLIYFERFDNLRNTGYKFSMEKIENGELKHKLMADYIKWDSLSNKWTIENYFIRNINGLHETIETGSSIDTTLNFHPNEFGRRISSIETMNYTELNQFIEKEESKGSENMEFYLIEKHKRFAFPFATFILTLIGVTVSSRKARGGIGFNIGIGLAISFAYILFMQVSITFATNANVTPMLAVWIPNILFGIIGVYLLRIAPK